MDTDEKINPGEPKNERTNTLRRIWNKTAPNHILTAKAVNPSCKQANPILGGDAQIQIIPIKSSELKRLARRPAFSALKNKKLENLGLRMRDWKEALREYLIEKGGMRGQEAKG